MKSLFTGTVRKDISTRLQFLKAEISPRWGKLTAPELVCHLTDTLRITFGESKQKFEPSFFSTRFGKWLVISSPIPWPKGKIKGLPAFFETKPSGKYNRDRDHLLTLIERFGKGPDQEWGISPVFGPLTPDQWGKLNYRHCDHHLRQFGQ